MKKSSNVQIKALVATKGEGVEPLTGAAPAVLDLADEVGRTPVGKGSVVTPPAKGLEEVELELVLVAVRLRVLAKIVINSVCELARQA